MQKNIKMSTNTDFVNASRRALIKSTATTAIFGGILSSKVAADTHDGINLVYESQSSLSSPTIIDSKIIFQNYNGILFAVDADSGDEIWKNNIGTSTRDSGVFSIYDLYENDNKIDRILVSSPVAVDGIVFVGSNDNNLHAVNAASGDELWSFETNGFMSSSPVVVDRTVFVGSDDNFLVCVYPEDSTDGTA